MNNDSSFSLHQVPTIDNVPSLPKLDSVPLVPSLPKLDSVPTVPSLPRMSDPEIELFKKYLSKSQVYFEFGSGGSTYLASTFPNILSITSVESDREWAKVVDKAVKKARVHYIDIGPVESWGKPLDKIPKKEWLNYAEAFDKREDDPDLILVDGRFRVSCALKVMLSELTTRPYILVHDFTFRREYYPLLKFFKVVEYVDTLVVFELIERTEFIKKSAEEVFEDHKFDYR